VKCLVKGPPSNGGRISPSDAKEEMIVDGWLATAISPAVDEDGYFYIVDRKKDMYLVSD